MTTSCSATIGQEPGAWGFTPIVCRQQVGVRTYVTEVGLRVGFCSLEGHEANVRRRFPELVEPPEPLWLHDQVMHEEHGGDESPDRDNCRICIAAINDFLRYGVAGDPPEHVPDETYARWFASRVR